MCILERPYFWRLLKSLDPAHPVTDCELVGCVESRVVDPYLLIPCEMAPSARHPIATAQVASPPAAQPVPSGILCGDGMMRSLSSVEESASSGQGE